MSFLFKHIHFLFSNSEELVDDSGCLRQSKDVHAMYILMMERLKVKQLLVEVGGREQPGGS